MRLWHKDLIPVLPRQQLLGQWREVCCIARNIEVEGSPNHILVNKIIDYPASHFNTYALAIYREMIKRKYKCDWEKYEKWCTNKAIIDLDNIFPDWHNERYLLQCFYNLQEKYDCGGITDEEWGLILDSITWMEMHYQQGKSESPLKDIHPKEIPTQRTEYKYKRKK